MDDGDVGAAAAAAAAGAAAAGDGDADPSTFIRSSRCESSRMHAHALRTVHHGRNARDEPFCDALLRGPRELPVDTKFVRIHNE